jgi:hypothetical protein
VRGPVGPRATADACHLAPAAEMLALLTLSPSSVTTSLDGRRCTYSVKDESGINGAWVNNRGDVQVAIEDHGTNAEALKFQHDQTPFYLPSTLVATTDPTDRVVLDPSHPGEVWAVHGPNYVTMYVNNSTAAAQAHPTWAYRVQRAALKVAGATIVPTPGMQPDPVVPRGAPVKSATSRVWTPPAHTAPPGAVVAEPVLHVLAFFARIRFYLLPVLVILPGLLVGWLASRRKASGRTMARPIWILAPILYGILNLVLGPRLINIAIYHLGVAGGAVVTATHGTSSQYNNQNIYRHDMLMRTVEGEVVKTGFDTDDFNVYPDHNAVIYPGVGDAFTVRYLSHFPKDFVIVANDQSPWATRLRCRSLNTAAESAGEALAFAPDDAKAKDAAAAAHRARVDAGCVAADAE